MNIENEKYINSGEDNVLHTYEIVNAEIEDDKMDIQPLLRDRDNNNIKKPAKYDDFPIIAQHVEPAIYVEVIKSEKSKE